MWELIMQMLLCLIIAAVIGFIVGYLLRHFLCKEEVASAKLEAEEKDSEIRSLKSDLSKAKESVASAGAVVSTSSAGYADMGRRFTDWGVDFEKLRLRIADLEYQATDDEEDTLDEINSWIEETKVMQGDIKTLGNRIDDFDDSQHEDSKVLLRRRWKELSLTSDSLAEILEKAKADKTAGIAKPKPKGYVAGERDDLKLIFGVGPVLERLLNEEGIYTFKQIALWTNADIEKMSGKLEGFQDRIIRDAWVAQAGNLHEEKYGERI